MSFGLSCPHCGQEHEDPFEVLDPDRLEQMRCEGCAKPFWFAIMECHRCAHEKVFTWSHAPALQALDLLSCDQCGSTFRYADASHEEEGVR